MNYIKGFMTGAISLISYIVGGFDTLVGVLIIVISLDYITGVMCGIYNKQLSSSVGFKGILKKICILSIICLSNIAGKVVGIEEIRTIAISFYIANESISVLENAGNMGVEFPQKLKEILIQLKNK